MTQAHSTPTPLRERILDTALQLADDIGWEAVRLHAVAARLDISLDDIRIHFREKESLTDAWLDRADASMLRTCDSTNFDTASTRERLQQLIEAWLDSLTPHRHTTRQMILGKLEPGHLHVQIPALLRISRTVQWLREAAGCEARYVRRAIEESVLTGIFVTTFITWLMDDTPGQQRTRARLDACLATAESLVQGGLPSTHCTSHHRRSHQRETPPPTTA